MCQLRWYRGGRGLKRSEVRKGVGREGRGRDISAGGIKGTLSGACDLRVVIARPSRGQEIIP